MSFLKFIILSLLSAASLGKENELHERLRGLRVSRRAQNKSDKSGGFVFLKSSNDLQLGSVSTASVHSIAFQNAATTTLQHILMTDAKATGQEVFSLAKGKKPIIDKLGRTHVRFEQSMDGLPVAGASMMMHMDEQGDVFAVNGEFVAEDSINKEVVLGCDEVLLDIASNPYYHHSTGLDTSTWLTDCELTIVIDSEGTGHMVWQRLLGYQPANGPYQKDLMFASVQTGDIVAVHPQVYGALSLETYDCNGTGVGTPYNCSLVSNSSDPINTGDIAIDDAHNFAIDTYKFYKEQYGRDSLDNLGLTLQSRVHAGTHYNNAGWDGTQMIYGDGDGHDFSYFSRSIEVVGHELTHGVTEFSSNLIYRDESGALNEAMSDIFGATISRNKGDQSPKNVWLIGEEVYTPQKAGDAVRNMANPYAEDGSSDFYYTRYRDFEDNGGVHANSGIANLAFYLLVSGGSHPRNRTFINVQAVDPDFDTSILKAAEIFYMANTACLTPNSGFFAARECTIMHAGAFVSNVEDAWTAVGVAEFNDELTDGSVYSVADLPAGIFGYTMKNIPAYSVVTCKTTGDLGDVDLIVDLSSSVGPVDTCVSEGPRSNEVCHVGPTRSEGTAVILLKALQETTKVTFKCSVSGLKKSQKLVNGVKKTDIKMQNRGRKAYILENVPSGSSMTCMTEVDKYNSDATLSVDLISPSASASCTATVGNSSSLIACTTGPVGAKGKAYVMLESFGAGVFPFLLCQTQVPKVLKDSISLKKQTAVKNSLTTYVLDNVAVNTQVLCKTNGNNGNADLLVSLATGSSGGSSCSSVSSDSVESCQVGPTKSVNKVYATIFASSSYRNLAINCATVAGDENNR